MVCLPDSQLIVRPGMEDKAAEVFGQQPAALTSIAEYTFGSQPLAAAFTDTETVDGRNCWPNVSSSPTKLITIMRSTVWCNSTLGLLSYWWHSSRQQSSKARILYVLLDPSLVLDLRALTDEQLRTAEAIFNEFRDLELKPAYLADADPNRAPPGPARRLRPPRLRRGHLRCSATARRQVVRRAVGPRRQGPAEGRQAHQLGETLNSTSGARPTLGIRDVMQWSQIP